MTPSRFFHLFLFGLLFAMPAAAQDRALPDAVIYSASEIAEARSLAIRVGWREGILDETLPSSGDNADRAWRQCAAAALFGGQKRIDQAVQSIHRAIDQAPAVEQMTPLEIARLLEGYDWLMVSPEWIQTPHAAKEELYDALEAFLSSRFNDIQAIYSVDERPEKRVYRNRAAWLALETLWGAQSKNSDWLERGWNARGQSGGLAAVTDEFITGEGMYGRSAGEHLQTANIFMLATAAVNDASPSIAAGLKPYRDAMLSAAASLNQPAGEWPGWFDAERPSSLQTAELFERGRRMNNDQTSIMLLNHVYQSAPRPAIYSLIGGSELIPSLNERHESTLMPQTGAAYLYEKSAPLSVWFDTGMSRFGSAAGLLSISLQNNDDVWAGSHPHEGTAGFNTVVIDGKDHYPFEDSWLADEEQRPLNGLAFAMRDIPGSGVYALASASGRFTERGAYANSQIDGFSNRVYQRSLYLTGNLLVDLFWAGGGERHDYRYRVNGVWERAADGETALAGDSPLSLKASGEGMSERLWSVNPAGLELRVGADGDAGAFNASYAGDEVGGNLFAMIHELQPDSENTRVLRIPLTPTVGARGYQAIAFAVERGGAVDLFAFSLNREVEYQGRYDEKDFRFQGDFGHLRLNNGFLETLTLIGGSRFDFDQYGLAANEAMQYGGLNQVSPGDAVSILPYSLPSPEDVDWRQSILALDLESPLVNYQPFWIQPTRYFVDKNQPQPLDLIQPALPGSGSPAMGLKLRPGCQLFYHHTLQLTRRLDGADEIYQLTTSAPARVRVPVWNNLKSLMLTESTVIDRRRGEELNGVIEFNLMPEETKNGRVTFKHLF